ncbi:bifunctional diaminohydroxyphosphoribosylaminopyrimidine deaminase/5-amino-6-(5-phosphoribosylamino)uracil reductase RibD [Allopontixanthobacter sp.]|uniref:bifunctional diaminohydroxyphosphoribosylaminopyrimidine deaminase/5-amino-6-(5-phosphoribosylamino)uracil reductase RibD n=1 Tax=Allopontixanthobacter sp. TaxID=2906452 RepID=UPI002ABC1F70|nr:bifunctional diaminohydroxyphosphoribosylaminopyrimidine deaminase/5-amino-6-(5-phosphoribosylamino)uracil reductase RibD [Allopontixanthobacter sp.]MDZ4306681.1 bifunctional diaminohydroxyphosphoribosylaminopyrimidine deaminase/5-amino-6-(5-phosphoribosylamino)uracil reductase RibD [Allopontixanthobacter sp.]
MQTRTSDADWLAAAARLAVRARPLSRPNPGVGAILVRDGTVIARGWTQAGGRPHAEAMALSRAGENARGAVLYVTLEPCAHSSDRGPACSDLVASAGLAALVYAVRDPDPRTAGEGAKRIADAGTEVRYVPCPAAADSLAGYLMREQHGRPHVTLKLAMSLDGCTALASGESQWITGEAARAHVHSRRAMADAILVGGGTWLSDRPRLDVRLPGLEARSPARYVLTRGETPEGVQSIASPQDITDMAAAQYLYVEGGAKTAAAFLAADLVDTLHLYRAPIILGGGAPSVPDIGLTDLASAHDRWSLTDRRQLGSDQFEAYRRVRSERD